MALVNTLTSPYSIEPYLDQFTISLFHKSYGSLSSALRQLSFTLHFAFNTCRFPAFSGFSPRNGAPLASHFFTVIKSAALLLRPEGFAESCASALPTKLSALGPRGAKRAASTAVLSRSVHPAMLLDS